MVLSSDLIFFVIMVKLFLLALLRLECDLLCTAYGLLSLVITRFLRPEVLNVRSIYICS